MDFNLTDNDRIQLENMLRENKVEDTTHKIQELQHSSKLLESLKIIEGLKKQYPRIYKTNYSRFEEIVRNRGGDWLWSHYTNIYHKLMKNELDPKIMYSMIQVLEKIERKELNQHEASVAVGKMLKQIYIDGVVSNDKPSYKQTKKKKQTKNISWTEYKQRFI